MRPVSSVSKTPRMVYGHLLTPNRWTLGPREIMRIHRLSLDRSEYLVISFPIQRPKAFACLTPREVDVVEAVLEGLSQEEIAKRRGVARRTVSNQLASAYKKLGVAGATELSILCGRRPS